MPKFQVDPAWPKIPNNWQFGQVPSVSIDARDHVWVLQRPGTKYYMVLQGILRACNQRAGFLAHKLDETRRTDRQIPRDEFMAVVDSEYANYVSLQEHIMGSMKSIQPHKDMPFDVGGFISGNRQAQPAKVEG